MAALFYLSDVYTGVIGITDDTKKVIRSMCRARPRGYSYMPRYRLGMWDGYISLLKYSGNKIFIPSGLMPDVFKELKDSGINYSYCYAENKPERKDDSVDYNLNTVTLRPYQRQAAVTMLIARRGIAKMATNAGKTFVFAALLRKLMLPSLIIVQSLDLLYQTSERLIQYLDSEVGIIGDGNFVLGEYATVATIQTLNSCRERHTAAFRMLSRDNAILIVDECHHVAHNKTFDILMEIHGWYRWGFSGTPLDRGELNDLKLIACTGPVLTEISNAELISRGHSSIPTIHLHDMGGVDDDAWDLNYHDAYVQCIVECLERNLRIVEIANDCVRANKSVLVIVKWIRHGEILLDMISSSNTNVMFVSGSSTNEERKTALCNMADGIPMVVIATTIFDEGVDVPALDSIILACGGRSTLKLLQRIGRGLRAKSGANEVEIHDFLDTDSKHLLEHSDARIGVYEQEGFKYELVE